MEAKRAMKSGEVAGVTPTVAEILFEGEEDVVEEERREEEKEENKKEQEFVVHVPLPDEREIENWFWRRRRWSCWRSTRARICSRSCLKQRLCSMFNGMGKEVEEIYALGEATKNPYETK
ncbi:hypothetical protein MRB53_005576 [Persea americana]|uniref:Uncharacterized protein n=1 Tax=Persea americana TaxID=3435 RepID=A0ACC2MEK4_PERAE|nr:hypothetical protein MRB53_005576 [Persea americana]